MSALWYNNIIKRKEVKNMRKILEIIGMIIGIICVVALVAAGILVETWFLMITINWVLGLFEVAFVLTLKQAFGINCLLSILGLFLKSSK